MLRIRPETPPDIPAIHAVHVSAFPTGAEANLVDQLRAAGRLSLSLLAEADEGIIGHVAFSPVTIGSTSGGLGLAPVGVRPAFQRRGAGSRLTEEGLAHARRSRVPFVVVLGDPKFYGRFGFRAASGFRLRDEYGGGPAFQALELIVGGIPPGGGLVRYAPEFALFE